MKTISCIFFLLFISTINVFSQVTFKKLYYKNNKGEYIIYSRYENKFVFMVLDDLTVLTDKIPVNIRKGNAYYTNTNGERITIPYCNTPSILYLTLETEKSIGEEVTVELSEEDPDFIYKRHYLTTGSLFPYIIEKDIETFKLLVFNENKKRHLRIKKRTLHKNALKIAQDVESPPKNIPISE